jgi:hypothetical protein
MAQSWIGRHFETSVKRNFIDHLKVFTKYIQFFKSVVSKSHILRLIYTGWCHFGLATILNQLKKTSYIISKHFQNVFIYLNRLKNAKTIGQKRKCTRWRNLGLAAILKRQIIEISYCIHY